MRSYTGIVASLIASALGFGSALAETKDLTHFEVKRDEFSNREVFLLVLGTQDTAFGTLGLACYPSGLQAQITVKEVIFPNGVDGGHMWLQVTQKVDTAADAATHRWRMNMGKYHDAWLMRGVETLIKEMQNGERLSLRLDRNGTIFRFGLKASHEHLPKLLAACAKQRSKKKS